jgi:hypothetical protein
MKGLRNITENEVRKGRRTRKEGKRGSQRTDRVRAENGTIDETH